MRQYPRRSSSVARQNQEVKQLRKRRTVRESLMDGLSLVLSALPQRVIPQFVCLLGRVIHF